ncbi:MAG TPA: VanZ family protein [Melioribacteraceae bacterium]|nr:VanZ family protein [Melioribacteraceae bacterium]
MIYDLMKKNSLYFVHIPFIAYFIILSVLLLMPSQKLPDVFEVSDKIKHYFAFLAFTFLFSLSCHFNKRRTIKVRNIFIIVGVLAVLYGGLTELIQSYVPGRSGDLYDLSLDALGSFTGIYLFNVFLKFSRLKLNKVGTKR